MTRKDELKDAIYNLAQNMHDMYELRGDVWGDLEAALDALWKGAETEGYTEGYRDSLEDSKHIIKNGGSII